MQARSFIETALINARISPEAFAEALESKDADINEVPTFYGHPLIHSLIQDQDIDDRDLPALLTILVEKGANFEIQDSSGQTPVSVAASHLKIETVRFLLDQRVEINNLPYPPIVCPLKLFNAEEQERLCIVELLLKNGADVNRIDFSRNSPLMLAVENSCPNIVSLLIDNDADISIKKYHYNSKVKYETPMGVAYREYNKYTNHTEPNAKRERAENVLEILYLAAIEYLYKECAGFVEDGNELYSIVSLKARDLADDFPGFPVMGKVSFPLELLTEKVIKPVFSRIQDEKEQREAFEKGCVKPTQEEQNQSKNYCSAINRFFQQTNGRDLVTHIFSYVHEITPHMEKINKIKKR